MASDIHDVPGPTRWDRNDFPALYRCADDASKAAQRCYLIWMAANLALMLIGAAASVVSNPVAPAGSSFAIYVAAGAFFLGVGVSLLLAYLRWEKTWFSGRAVAESVKSLTWKYSAGAEPFPTTLSAGDALDRLTSQFSELLKEHRELAAAFAGPEAGGEQVTAMMTELRRCVSQKRRDVYLVRRVQEQQAWYAREACNNRSSQRNWWIAFIASQVIACLATVIAATLDAQSQIAGLFATLAAAILAWSQVRRCQELAQAYGYAAQELSLIAARATSVSTDDELARFVADSETAISREHTAWVARRETS